MSKEAVRTSELEKSQQPDMCALNMPLWSPKKGENNKTLGKGAGGGGQQDPQASLCTSASVQGTLPS